MSKTTTNAKRGRRRPYMMAMVLGTALTALGGSSVPAAESADPTHRAVNDLSRYCTTCWKNARLPPDRWTDCTQEVLTRLLERVDPEAWGRALKDEGEERREFLRAIDTVKKRTQRARRFAPETDAVADRRDLERRRRADDREAVDRAAEEVLSPRQRQIVHLSFEGFSVQEIADELRTPPERVSDEKYKAIRKLRSRLSRA